MALLDLFRSKVFHSNPRIRIQELKNISDINQNIFASIVKKDQNHEVRQVALQRLTEWESLLWASKNEPHDENRKLAQKKLNEIAYRHARDAEDETKANLWVDKLQSNKSLQDLARTAKLSSVRIAAIERLTKENFLAEILLEELNTEVAQAAIAKVNKPNLIEKIFQNAKSQDIRLLAKAKRPPQIESKQPSNVSNTDLELAKRKVILHKLEAYDQRSKVLDLADDFLTLSEEWSLLSAQASEEENKRVEDFKEHFREKKTKEEAEKAAEEEAVSRQLKLIEQATFLQDKLKQYSELYAATDDGRTQFQDLQQEWNQWSHAAESYQVPPSITQSIDNLFRIIRDIHNRLDTQALDSEQRVARRHDLLGQIEKLSLKTELSIADGKVLRKIILEWNHLGPIDPGQQEIFSVFGVIEDKLQKTLDNLEKVAIEAKESKVKALQAIIEKTNSLKIEDNDLNQSIRKLHQSWKATIEGEFKEYDHLYKEFKEALSPFTEVRQWEEWHNEKLKVELIEKARKLSEVSEEEELYSETRKLQDSWKAAGPIQQSRHQELWEEFKTLQDNNFDRCQGVLEKMEAERVANLEKKKALILKVSELVSSISNWKETQSQINSIQEEWKVIGGVPREVSQTTWDEFRQAIDQFYAKRKIYYKQQDESRLGNLSTKVQICESAEALKESEEWSETSKTLISLQKQWKDIGPVPRKDSDAIWARFREACDCFFDRKKTHFNQLDEARVGNLEAKEKIIVSLEALLEGIPENLFNVLLEARESWLEAGPVPRKNSDEVWERFGTVQDKLIDKGLAEIPSFAKQIKSDIDAKVKLLERAKTVAESTDWSGTANVLKEMQQEWKELNRVGSQESELWKSFRSICDEFFDRRKDQYEIMDQTRQNNLRDKEILLKQAQELASRAVSSEVQREIKMLRKQWKEIGHVPKKHSDRIWNAFNKACDSCFPKSDD